MLTFRHILPALLLAAPAAAAQERVEVQMLEVAQIDGGLTLGDVCRGDLPAGLAATPVAAEDPSVVTVEDVLRSLRQAGVEPHRVYVSGPAVCSVEAAPIPVPAPAGDDEWSFLREPEPTEEPEAAAEPEDRPAVVERLALTRPVRRGQTLRPDDLRVVQTEDPGRTEPLALDAAVGQRAARDLDVGDLLDADHLAARLLVERGQLLALRHDRGGVTLRTLARSRDDAAFGQTARAVCETAGTTYRVRMTGPQAGVILD